MLLIEDLSFGFPQRPLFDSLSLEVKAGEMVRIAGPNGAGKSTFMSIVAGLLKPWSGAIRYFDEPGRTQECEDRRARLELLPAEANGLYLKMDATENLRFWSQLRGRSWSREEIFAALGRWDLNHPLLRDGFPVEKFSTGMKRRLALARLSLSGAPCWLLDEPVYGLDQEAIAVFRELVGQHLADGGEALVVSHETGAIDGLVSRTVSLEAQGGAKDRHVP